MSELTAERIEEIAADVTAWPDGEYPRTAVEDLLAALRESLNDVDHWKVKAECYGNMVHACSPALERAGFPVDRSQDDGAVGGVRRAVEALAADRDRLAQELANTKDQLKTSTKFEVAESQRADRLAQENERLAAARNVYQSALVSAYPLVLCNGNHPAMDPTRPEAMARVIREDREQQAAEITRLNAVIVERNKELNSYGEMAVTRLREQLADHERQQDAFRTTPKINEQAMQIDRLKAGLRTCISTMSSAAYDENTEVDGDSFQQCIQQAGALLAEGGDE